MTGTVYFKQLETPLRTRNAASSIYNNPSKSEADLFHQLNGLTSGNGMLYPGHFLAIPGTAGVDENHRGLVTQSSQSLNFHGAMASRPPAPRSFNENFYAFLYAERHEIGIDIFNQFVEGRSSYTDILCKSIKNDIELLNDYYMASQGTLRGSPELAHNALRRTAFADKRQIIEMRIREKMAKIPRGLSMMKSDGVSIDDIRNISRSAVKRAFDVKKLNGKIKKLGEAIDKADSLARSVAKNATKIGFSLQVATGAMTLYDNFAENGSVSRAQRANPNSADIIGFHSHIKAAGNVAGGYVGGVAGGLIVALVLGNPVGLGALAVVGVATVAAGAIGGWAGGEVASQGAERAMKAIDPSRATEIDMIVNAED